MRNSQLQMAEQNPNKLLDQGSRKSSGDTFSFIEVLLCHFVVKNETEIVEPNVQFLPSNDKAKPQ